MKIEIFETKEKDHPRFLVDLTQLLQNHFHEFASEFYPFTVHLNTPGSRTTILAYVASREMAMFLKTALAKISIEDMEKLLPESI